MSRSKKALFKRNQSIKSSVELNEVPINEYIKDCFKIRYCYVYKGNEMLTCVCNRKKEDHKKTDCIENDEWSHMRNTKTEPCNVYGKIKFKSHPYATPSDFIRFDVVDNLEDTVQECFRLVTLKWKKRTPSLIISVDGGHKKMNNLTNQSKKNFKQGLINVMTKDATWVISGGFNIGIHKLVSDAVQEFRCYYEDLQDRVQLLAICSWGVVQNNHKLMPPSNIQTEKDKDMYSYDSKPNDKNEKGKVMLDENYDCFLFCDDGTVKTYDVDALFRIKFQKYIEDQHNAYLVHVLFEGGKGSIATVKRCLENKIPVVIIKGSGRSSNLISDVTEMSKIDELKIRELVISRSEDLKILDHELDEYIKNLIIIVTEYKKQIIIYDMFDPKKKLDKAILEAIITSKTEPLEKVLELSINFQCPDVAKTHVFSNQKFYQMNEEIIKKRFFDVLIQNQPKFVEMFIENEINIQEFMNKDDNLRKLHEKLFDTSSKSMNNQIAEVLKDLSQKKVTLFSSKSIESNELIRSGNVIETLSGNILCNPYNKKYNEETINQGMDASTDSFKTPIKYNIKDLYLWSLLSGYTKISEILWESGPDHLSSALIGATILKNLANYMHSRGYSQKYEIFTEASDRFQLLSNRILDEAYSKNKHKTYDLLIRTMDQWNDKTVLQIAISSNMLEFINNSACISYITEVWMGKTMSPFTSNYKILLAIPCFIMIPSITRTSCDDKKHNGLQDNASINVKSEYQLVSNTTSTYEPCYHPNTTTKQSVSSILRFYTVPVVKFYLYLICYIGFLMCFSYVNVFELRPISQVHSIKDVLGELFVDLYVFAFFLEEVRQIREESQTSLLYKIRSYLNGSWNIFDSLMILLFISGTICRFLLPIQYFIIARCLLSLSLTSFCLRTMQFFFVSKNIGPKVIMIRKMLQDILFFLSIFGVFVVAYGTLAKAMVSPNSEFTFQNLADIFYLPYFQTYGELMLDKLEKAEPCNTTECKVSETTVLVSFAIFLLLTNVLLVNLLIAMFGYTFNQIQEKSEKYYSYIRIQLVQEFYHKPICPPPFTLIYYFFSILFYCMKLGKKKSNMLRKKMSERDNNQISQFEQMCAHAAIFEKEGKHDTPNSNDENMSEQLIEQFMEIVVNKFPEVHKSPRKLDSLRRLSVLQKSLDRLHSTRF